MPCFKLSLVFLPQACKIKYVFGGRFGFLTREQTSTRIKKANLPPNKESVFFLTVTDVAVDVWFLLNLIQLVFFTELTHRSETDVLSISLRNTKKKHFTVQFELILILFS